MKKNIFIILISILLILILTYFYDKKESVLNKEYKDHENNIYIEYPYFNDKIIDTYINKYLNTKINDYQNKEEFLFIDYDYQEVEKTELIIYIYKEMENIVKNEQQKFEIDRTTSTITKKNTKLSPNTEYDIYYQKLINKENPMIALTFDDGPNHNTSKILDILEKYSIKATFFILGTNIKGNEKIIARMNRLGNEIGNHMYSHKLLTKLSKEKISNEIKQVDDLIFNIIGEYPTLIRPSYGTYNKKVKSLIDRPIIIWNIDTLDWKSHNSQKISNKVLKKASDGDIVLMHDIYNATANSLEIIIPKLLEKNFQFVTVSELLYYKGINLEEGRVYSRAK